MLMPWCARAMITVVDSGKRYASRQDQYYGPTFRKGYQYMARLQLLSENRQLCPNQNSNNTTYDVVEPIDGYPVALLVHSGGCSFMEKINFVRDFVKPSRAVKYLIFDSSSYVMEGHYQEDGFDNNHDDDEDFIILEGVDENEPPLKKVVKDFFGEESFVGRKHHPETRDSSIPQHILHVSPRTERALFELLIRQSPSTYMSGGIHIIMDSRIGNSVIQQSTALWIAFSALMGACCCSFLLILSGTRNGWWEVPEPTTAPQPTRPQRRRLTKEQVRRLFPVYVFNGEALEAMEETVPLTAAASSDVENNKKAGPGDVLRGFVPRPLELSLCSICLDEYEPGDRLRCLDPCHHAFHSKCIGRWLSERSATCPLCKMELYDPDEEEEESDEEEERGQPQRRQQPQQQQTSNQANDRIAEASRESADFRSRFLNAFNPPSLAGVDTNMEATPGLVAVRGDGEASPTPSATLELDDNASSVVEHFRRPWWRRMRRWFSSHDGNIDMDNSTLTLAQPLLGGEINTPAHMHHQGLSTEGNLMMPLESTLASPENNPLAATNSIVTDIVAAAVETPTNHNGGEPASGALTTLSMGEDPVPDPPGQHANAPEFSV
ncbi:hypothetical protein ACA910_013619 [Epithemia clementina (nom. ined.)]